MKAWLSIFLVPVLAFAQVTQVGAGAGKTKVGAGAGKTKVAATAATYKANLVGFAGDNQCWMTTGAALTGAVDGTQGTISVWIKTTGLDGATQEILHDNTGNVELARNNSNNIQLRLKNSAGVDKVYVLSLLSNYTASHARFHILYSWKNTSVGGFAQLYIDDVVATNTITFAADDTNIDWTDTDWAVGDLVAGGIIPFKGDMAELYVNNVTSLDLSVTANRRKFITAALAPVDLGSDGSTPTGSAPIVYLKTAGTGFTANSGTGGNFTKRGTTALVNDGTFP